MMILVDSMKIAISIIVTVIIALPLWMTIKKGSEESETGR